MNTSRIVTIIIDNFSLSVLQHQHPELKRQPMAAAVVEGELADTAAIIAINECAIREGVTTGMTVTQAKGRCPDLVVHARLIDIEQKISAHFFEILTTISPFVEQCSDGFFYLAADGLTRLYKNEQGLVERILFNLRSAGLPIRIGIGPSRFVSRVAAMRAELNQSLMIEPGTERRFLNNLSLDYLDLPDHLYEKLNILGLKTIGQVAAMPISELTKRFSADGRAVSTLARGADIDHFLPQHPPEKISRRLILDYSLTRLESIRSIVRKTLSNQLDSLSQLGLGCSSLQLIFTLENYQKKKINLALKEVTITASKFIRQLTDKLATVELSSPINEITLIIPEAKKLTSGQTELSVFDLPATKPGRPIENIGAVTPRLNNSILPENSFTPDKLNVAQDESTHPFPSYSLSDISGLRLLKKSLPTEVTIKDGQLITLTLQQRQYRIIRHGGPWRLSGHWWRNAFERSYFEIETDDRRHLLLYYDRTLSRWFLQGIYD